MRNDLSSELIDSTPSIDSEQKVRIPYKKPEQGSPDIHKKLRLPKLQRIGEILPCVMANIKKRREIAICSLQQISTHCPYGG